MSSHRAGRGGRDDDQNDPCFGGRRQWHGVHVADGFGGSAALRRRSRRPACAGRCRNHGTGDRRRHVDTRAAKARAAFSEVCAGADVKAVWRDTTGRETDVVASAGRLTDLIIIGRPDAETETPLAATLDAALFDTGRPVLVAPPAVPPSIGARAVLAWNGSAQAARVVAGALPILRKAEQVTVVTVGEIGRSPSATDLVAYLGRHDVRATHEAIAADHGPVGAALLKHAKQIQADLLIMGAYGHSRLREMILGGATRDVLGVSDLPLLMAH